MTKDFAAGTKTSIATTEAQIKTMLQKHGADAFGMMEERDRAIIAFRLEGRHIQFRLPLPTAKDERFTHYRVANGRGPAGNLTPRTEEAARNLWVQACRERWRQLHLCIKAKLEAVAQDIETFDESFMPHIVMPDGETLGDKVLGEMQAQLAGKPMRPLLAPPDRRSP